MLAHPDNMKKVFCIIFVLLVSAYNLYAQEKIEGIYDARNKLFGPKDTNIIVAQFTKGNLAPFMIKGKDPFSAKENHVGFIDTTGRIIIPPVYNNCSYFEGDHAMVTLAGTSYYDNKLGTINREGKVVIPLEYNKLSRCVNGLFVASKDNKLGIIDINNNIIVPFGKYSDHSIPPPNYDKVDDVGHSDFRWGLLNFDQEAVLFKDYIGVKSGNKWAVIDSTGTEIIPAKFDGIGIFKQNLAAVKIGAKYAVINNKGSLIVPPLYDQIRIINQNRIYAHNETKVGVIDANNHVIIPIAFDRVTLFGDGYTAYTTQYDATLFDIKGKQIVSGKHSNSQFPVWLYDQGKAIVYSLNSKKYNSYQKILEYHGHYTDRASRRLFYKRTEKWGVMDTLGTELTKPLFDSVDYETLSSVDEKELNLFAVTKDKKYGAIDKVGNILLEVIYDKLIPEASGFFVKKDGKYGFYDVKLSNRQIKKIIPAKYDSLVLAKPYDLYNPSIESYFYRSKINNKWGLITYTGKEVFAPKYDTVKFVASALSVVQNNGKYGVVNAMGKQVVDCIYDNIAIQDRNTTALYYNNQVLIKKDGKCGLANENGIIIAPVIYDKLTPYLGKYYLVTINSEIGMLDAKTGKQIIPCTYTKLSFFEEGISIYEGDRSPYLFALKDGRWGLIDTLNLIKLPFIYDRIHIYRDDYYVTIDKKTGLFNKELKLIIPVKYVGVSKDEAKNIYVIRNHEGLGLVNKDGRVLVETGYDSYYYCGDKIILSDVGKFGTISLDGKIIDDFIYNKIECRGGVLIKTK